MSIIERIYQLIDYKNDSVYKISNEIGVSNGYFSKTRAKKGSVGGDIIEKIVNYYTDVNVEWLVTGKGEMLKNGDEKEPNMAISSLSNDKYSQSLEKNVALLEAQLKDKEAIIKEKEKYTQLLEKNIANLEAQLSAHTSTSVGVSYSTYTQPPAR